MVSGLVAASPVRVSTTGRRRRGLGPGASSCRDPVRGLSGLVVVLSGPAPSVLGGLEAFPGLDSWSWPPPALTSSGRVGSSSTAVEGPATGVITGLSWLGRRGRGASPGLRPGIVPVLSSDSIPVADGVPPVSPRPRRPRPPRRRRERGRVVTPPSSPSGMGNSASGPTSASSWISSARAAGEGVEAGEVIGSGGSRRVPMAEGGLAVARGAARGVASAFGSGAAGVEAVRAGDGTGPEVSARARGGGALTLSGRRPPWAVFGAGAGAGARAGAGLCGARSESARS